MARGRLQGLMRRRSQTCRFGTGERGSFRREAAKMKSSAVGCDVHTVAAV